MSRYIARQQPIAYTEDFSVGSSLMELNGQMALWSTLPAVQSCLKTVAIKAATIMADRRAQRAIGKVESKTTIAFGSAAVLATRLRSTDQEADWTKLEEKAQDMGVSILVNKKARPIEAIREAVKAANIGKPIQE